MKRVIITVSSQHSQDRTRAMKDLNTGERQITDEEDRTAVSPTKIDNHTIKEVTTEDEITAENTYNTWKSTALENDTLCDICSGIALATDPKQYEAKQCEVEDLKAKLEEALFERLKVEDEFATEKEHLEREILNLKERIDELEGEASWKIEELENNFKLLTTKYENAKDEITHLKVMLERTVSENARLRNNQSITDDRVIEILDEVELWKRKAQENAEKGHASRTMLQDEIEMNEREILELKETLKETCKLNETRQDTQQEITCDCRKLDDNVNEPLLDTIQSENLAISNEKQLLELSSELNELYRDHVDYQDKYFELNQGFISKEKELDDLRGDFESQNIEIQNYKERYVDLQDVVLATAQENSHLKNRLDKKAEEYKELKKTHLVLETEVMWLREALGLIKSG